MTSSDPFASLVRIGKLREEEPARAEFEGLIRSGEARLTDARNEGLSLESRFDLAYNAAHAIALAALRLRGYRSTSRYFVFQLLEHTLDMPKANWRLLAKCHDMRNRVEYEGVVEVDERLVADLIEVTGLALRALRELDPLEEGA